MKNWIIKSNEWYNNLLEPIRFLLLFFVVTSILTISQYCFILLFPIFALIVVFWRFGYEILKK